jgi:hypothetical protein
MVIWQEWESKDRGHGCILQPPDLMSASCRWSMQCRETVADMLLLW